LKAENVVVLLLFLVEGCRVGDGVREAADLRYGSWRGSHGAVCAAGPGSRPLPVVCGRTKASKHNRSVNWMNDSIVGPCSWGSPPIFRNREKETMQVSIGKHVTFSPHPAMDSI
jgi:hypothetical protein